ELLPMNTNPPSGPAITNAKSQNTGYAGCPSRNQNCANSTAPAAARATSSNTPATNSLNRRDRSADGFGPLPSSPAYCNERSTSATISGPEPGTDPPTTAADPSASATYHSAGSSGANGTR